MKKILYFSAAWCGPCKTFGPIIQESGVPHEKIDVDSNSELSAKYGIRSIPALVLVDDNGNELNRSVGILQKQQLINFYNG
jgi:thioredoxin 1|tara:strand:- start:870 stop:1112 length:243 start_codon:yes stop_codon:yes gene_type:complete